MMISFRTLRRLTLLIGAATLAATAGPPVLAADLIIGRAAEQSSIDPLFSRTGNNESTSEQIKTARPLPQLIEQISFVFILSKKAATGLSTADFNAGKGVIGTGPYKFVAWKPGQSITLKKNAGYWGKKADFENVTLKFIPKD